MDLHTHTPASSDYEEPGVTYLDWLRVAANRGLDIVAITDHNTVAGVAAIRREIEWLTRLEQQNRLNDEERAALSAWRELSNRVLVLPGFEFTATFGFHILGIFPPETSVRTLEHILLSLKVPPEKIDIGSTETGSATDVLFAYRVIREAGGLAIAAHANSTHGVAMRNFPFGGQTKIAYTQDVNLDALEVTDLEHRGYSTARFFNGSKSEYPRRMHSVQGSDAHRLTMDASNPKRLGIGERATEVFLEDSSFEALAALLRSTEWELVRPARPKERAFDALATARAAGPGLLQSFHVSATKAGGNADAILADICAFANTAGGAVYVGVSLRRDGPQGLARPNQVEQQILDAVGERIAPSLVVRSEIVKSDDANVLRLQVPRGDDRPYAVDGTQIWLRDDKQTRAATRDEIVAMVLEAMEQQSVPLAPDVEMIVEQIAAADAVEGTAAQVEEQTTKPRARRSRRGGSRSGTRKVVLEIADIADDPAADAPEAEASASDQPVEEMAYAAPPATEAALVAVEFPTVEAVTVSPSGVSPAHKPKARRGLKKMAAVEVAPTLEAEPVAEAPVVAPPAETKPKTTRRKLTSTARSATADASTNRATTAEAATAEPSTAKGTSSRSTTTRGSRTRSTKSVRGEGGALSAAEAKKESKPARPATRATRSKAPSPAAAQSAAAAVLPQIGVEIVESEMRGGVMNHSIRDLRNGSIIKGVTRRGARDLWNYAIRAVEEKRFDVDDAEWMGEIGLLHVEKRAGKTRYDLALRTPEGVRVFYGVTEEGMPAPWSQFVLDEDEQAE